MDMNLSHVIAGDIVTFRCGGVANVQQVKESDYENYPIEILISGYHCVSSKGWNYKFKIFAVENVDLLKRVDYTKNELEKRLKKWDVQRDKDKLLEKRKK